MSAISLKSITGITSITTPAGVDNVFTVHTNDTTERFRIDQTGNQNIVGIVTVTKDLDVDGHTNLDNVSIAGVSTFSDDVTLQTANSNNILLDKSDNSLKFGDSTYAKFGGSGELMIYHDGTYSVIKDTNSSPFNFEATGTITFAKAGLSETYAKMIPDGAVELYHNGSKKFETTSAAANFTVASNGQVNLFGLGGTNGLRISGPQSASSAFLFFNTNHQNVSGGTDQYTIQCGGANHTLMFKHGNSTGNVVFELDDSEHVRIPQDGKALKIGAGQDLQLRHDGSNSIIDNNTGDLILRSDADDVKILAEDGIVLRDNDDSTNFINCINGGAVELYHSGTKKFETTSSGIGVSGNVKLNDNYSSRYGTHEDLLIFHDGNSKIVNQNNSCDLRIYSDAIELKSNSGDEMMIKGVANGAVQLYFDNSLKFKTDSIGCEIAGALIIPDGSASSNRISVGNAGDLKIYHDGSNSRIENSTGSLVLNSRVLIKTADNSESIATFNENGAVELYHNNVKKFQTQSDGVEILSTGNWHGLEVKHSNGNVVAKLQNKGSGDEGYLALYDSGEVVSIQLDGEHGRLTCDQIRIGGNNDANQLEDYEEGTFTGYLRSYYDGTSGQVASSDATYTKIGRKVFIQMRWLNPNTNGLPNGSLIQIGNMPFQPDNHKKCISTNFATFNVNLVSQYARHTFETDSNGWFGQINYNGSWGSWAVSNWRTSALYFYFSGTYLTEA